MVLTKNFEDQLRITEIFFSLQGETNTVGLPTAFVRLTGCPLRCHYCDTSYAFHGGRWYQVTEVVQIIKKYRTKHITVTGGEPLSQKSCLNLLKSLCDEKYVVSLETSGALDISQVDSRVIKIVDIKTPGSGEQNKNNWNNIPFLLSHDQIKFVICDRTDYEWAKKTIEHYNLYDICQILFSPSYQQMNPTQLADWILQDRLTVRFQIQLHKFLWGDVPGK